MENETLQNQEVSQEPIQDIKDINQNINSLLEFFQNEKKEEIKKNELQQKEEKEEQKIQDQENLKLKEEQKLQQEKEKKAEEEQATFYSNIQTIAENTETQTTIQLLEDVSTLMKVNVTCVSILIGILIISVLSRFLKK